MVLNDVNEARVNAAAEKMCGDGLTTTHAAFDVTDQSAVAAVHRIEQERGAIEILVNNAGIQRRAPLEDFAGEDWDAILRVNLSSVFYVSQAVARRMIPRRRGKIINICSVQSQLARQSIAP